MKSFSVLPNYYTLLSYICQQLFVRFIFSADFTSLELRVREGFGLKNHKILSRKV